MIQLFIDSDKRLWFVDENGRMRKDAGSYPLFFGENEFEEIEISCVTNIHGNVIRLYDTSLVVTSDEERIYPVSFSLSDAILISDPIPVDAAMMSRAGEIAAYVRFEYQGGVVGRTTSIHFRVRPGVCEYSDIPCALRIEPKSVPQEFSCPSGYDRVEVTAVESEELDVIPNDTRQVFLPANGKYFCKVTVERPAMPLQDVTVTPSYDEQYIHADADHFAMGTVVVEPMLSHHNLVRKTVTPSVSEQHITPDSGYVAISEVTVNAVTADIDSDIRSDNIREGVSILGVEGILEPAPVRYKQIRFIDYDGAVLHDYTKAEFAALEELPAVPSHEGLTAVGWTHTAAEIASLIQRADDEIITVGAVYSPTDGKSRLNIELGEAMTVTLNVFPYNYGSVLVDWGDGDTDTCAASTYNGGKVRFQHAYDASGSYSITVARVTGKYALGGGDASSPVVTPGSILKSAVICGEYISAYAFARCFELRSVVIAPGLTEINTYVFDRCKSLRSVVLPNSVVNVRDRCFCDCGALESVAFPNSIRYCGSAVFQNNASLSAFVIPVDMTVPGQRMFSGCSSLSSVLFAGDITEVNYYAFENCVSLRKISLPDSVTYLRDHAFSGCKSLERFTLPADTVAIEPYAFFGCKNMRTFTANSVLRSIGNQALDSCESLTELSFPSTLTSVGEWAFSACALLVGIDISALAAAPGKNVFSGCYSLTAFPTLNASMTTIVEGMFSECYGLENVTLPATITRINRNAFYNCKLLKRFDLRQMTAVPTLDNTSVFSFCPADMQFIVRDETQKAAFLADSVWNNYSSKFVIEA